MATVAIIFWVCLTSVVYTFVGYPLGLAICARLRGKAIRRGDYFGTVSIILTVRNEEREVRRRVAELLEQLQRCGRPGELIVVSDGSTDKTAEILQEDEQAGLLRFIDLQENIGKAAALSRGASEAYGDILVFADARQLWAKDALCRMLENFADPSVGAVSGDLVLESQPGVLAGVQLYWRFEKWLRKQESALHSQVGVTGAICAVRRIRFCPIPAGTLLDDVHWPLEVALQGWRVIHDERAIAYDRLPAKPRDEFARKVRTLAGNFQLAARLPKALVPWRNPIWSAFVSHKLMRLVAPWAVIVLLITSGLLNEPVYKWTFWVQLEFLALAMAGLLRLPGSKLQPVAGAASFLVLNAAAWLAFWVWILGRTGSIWTKTHYEPEPRKSPVLVSEV